MCENWAGGNIEESSPGEAGAVSSIPDNSLVTGTDGLIVGCQDIQGRGSRGQGIKEAGYQGGRRFRGRLLRKQGVREGEERGGRGSRDMGFGDRGFGDRGSIMQGIQEGRGSSNCGLAD